ncbi:hypothetical protein Efla_007649 [Eimeria flavescens]
MGPSEHAGRPPPEALEGFLLMQALLDLHALLPLPSSSSSTAGSSNTGRSSSDSSSNSSARSGVLFAAIVWLAQLHAAVRDIFLHSPTTAWYTLKYRRNDCLLCMEVTNNIAVRCRLRSFPSVFSSVPAALLLQGQASAALSVFYSEASRPGRPQSHVFPSLGILNFPCRVNCCSEVTHPHVAARQFAAVGQALIQELCGLKAFASNTVVTKRNVDRRK